MRKYLLLLVFFIFSSGFSQDFKNEWRQVIQFELDGKVKSASEVVDEIYKKAKRKKIEDQIIKCFFYQSKFLQVSDENYQSIVIENLRKEILDAKGSQLALLKYIYVDIIEDYYQNNSYQIKRRTDLAQNNTTDFPTWTKTDFKKEIERIYASLLVDETVLHQTNIGKFASVFEISPYTDAKKMSVYDFLHEKVIDYNFSNFRNYEKQNYKQLFFDLIKNPISFTNLKTDTISNTNLKSIITIFQNNEKYALKNGSQDVDALQYNRMKSFYDYMDSREKYFDELGALLRKSKNDYLLQDIKVDYAKYYFNLTSKGGEKNYYPEVLVLADSILQKRENINAKVEAENLKEQILKKNISLNLTSTLYPNQNYRAFITYKNVDTIKVSYYKIPLETYKQLENQQYFYKNLKGKPVSRDSIALHYISKNKALKSAVKVLPLKTDHFEYSTEVLMDNLEVGRYLVFFETNNPYHDSKKAFAYKTIQVSNIDFVQQSNDRFDSFTLLERKSGKPIENAKVQNDEIAVKSDKLGKAQFPLTEQKKNLDSDILFIKDNDTLYDSYVKTRKYEETTDNNFEAKAMVFFDRAIYRPGQKVFFKGYIFQNKNNVKSVVPNLTVHVIIENADGDEVKKFDVQTNEFGSFSGEYDIPKNVLTGEFTIKIEEPDDYEVDTKYYDKKEEEHAFWDNVDYDDYQNFTFKVEEYKRPTFEITFNEIKENYTFGDTVTLKGNAKSLAGSNLTNAKVVYSVGKYIRLKKGYYDNNDNNVNGETVTDEEGNFKIVVVANQDHVASDTVESININIKATITDLNGETRTQNTTVVVGDKMLKLNGIIDSKIIQEENNRLTIKATTLNNFPINTKGTITFYEQNRKDFLIKRERFPEINSISRETFEQLFPYEAFDEKDEDIVEKKVLTIPFDTEKTTNIDLSFLKNFKLTNYKVVLEAKDQKGNEISSENNFELTSKNENATKKNLFIVNQLDNDKNNFVFEIKSVVPDLYITTRFFENSRDKSEEVTQLKNGTATVKISRKAKIENDLYFHFSTMWEGNYFSDEINITKEEIITPLDFEIVSMRNKIEPGSTENWSFVLKNTKLQAEVLASMYDTSLDQFAITQWKTAQFNHQTSKPEIWYKKTHWYNNNIRFNNLGFNSIYNRIYNPAPELNWFGFNFNEKNDYVNNQYLKKVKSEANIPKNAKTVYGKVSDGEFPLPGALVYILGTDRGVQTDFEGDFKIDVEKGETIGFRYSGFREVKITYNKEKYINVNFEEESISFMEKVVVSEGGSKDIKSRANATYFDTDKDGAPDFIDGYGNGSLLASLQGQIAGLNLEMSSDSIGNSSIIIRGVGSVSASSDPLYVIDGIPINAEQFRNLKEGDIQSISVLKDASATALYGSRGANGVIIITTKSEMKALEQVKTRTNFNETAFFMPNLLTDSKGNINFSFTTPESLTRWKLRLFGHNKKAETGYFETDIISQKDIMVMPNMPRFVREKDVIQLATKVINMTNETKSGNAILLLFDAATNTATDSIAMNVNNVKLFNCKAKESVVVNWTVTIPEGVQGLRYKVIAKSGTTSDGEENILPVLTDKILITESLPIWVKGNTKREFTFENLKNNTSTTLQNHALTFEYTSNPVWMALQSLPYLMTYEHECSEQVFAKYYANYIAEKIITSNPKIENLFQKWRDEKSVNSKFQMNEELKSIVLAETPWLLDAESDAEKNKRLAVLMDLSTLNENNAETYKKLEEKMLPSGGFPWFSGGTENQFISQHILAGIGRLNKLFPEDSLKYKTIISKGIPNLDSQFVSRYSKNNKIGKPSTLELNNLYTRSFYLKDYPISNKNDSIIKLQLKQCKEDWLQYSLYEKGLLALVMNRFNEKEFAKKIIGSLKETVSNNDEIGMYWIENKSTSNWFQSSIATQALLIEAFAEIDRDKETIDGMKVWLLKNKQTKNWATTKSTTEAVYALMTQGSDWSSLKESTKIKIGDVNVSNKEEQQETGYLKVAYKSEEIKPKMSTISIDNKSQVPGFGGFYWQYFESLTNIKSDETKVISIDKKLFKKVKTASGEELIAISSDNLKVGDLLTVRLVIKSDTDLEFVHLKDLRASGLEPVAVISKHEWKGNFSYYKSTKDLATHFFFDQLNKGTYVLEYDLRVTNQGIFNSGISTLQSMYAPEFSAYSESSKVIVKE